MSNEFEEEFNETPSFIYYKPQEPPELRYELENVETGFVERYEGTKEAVMELLKEQGWLKDKSNYPDREDNR